MRRAGPRQPPVRAARVRVLRIPARAAPAGEALLFVGDLAEPRKRFDRVIALMERLRESGPSCGWSSSAIGATRSATSCRRIARTPSSLRGYVDEADLRRAYAESLGLVLLSDFEAFGIPILEALACGTPVFLTRLDDRRGASSGRSAGPIVCPADDPEATARVVAATLDRGRCLIGEAAADLNRLRATFGWEGLAERNVGRCRRRGSGDGAGRWPA